MVTIQFQHSDDGMDADSLPPVRCPGWFSGYFPLATFPNLCFILREMTRKRSSPKLAEPAKGFLTSLDRGSSMATVLILATGIGWCPIRDTDQTASDTAISKTEQL